MSSYRKWMLTLAVPMLLMASQHEAIAQPSDSVNDIFEENSGPIDLEGGIDMGELIDLSRRLNGPIEAPGARTEAIDSEVLRYRTSQERQLGPGIFEDEAEGVGDGSITETSTEVTLEGTEGDEVAP